MKRFLACIITFVMLLSMAACSSSDLEYVKDKGTLIIGITEYDPMHIKTEEGEWIGFDAEFAGYVTKELGVEAEFKLINWDEKVDLLNSKEIDCIWNGYSINEADPVDFSAPYAKNSQVLVVRSANKSGYTLSDLNDMSIAVEKGSSSERLAKENQSNVKAFATQKECLIAVSGGDVQGCIVDKVIFDSLVHTDLEIVLTLNTEKFGIGFRRGSNLTDRVNNSIESLLDNGTLDKLAQKYDIELVK